MQAGDIATPDTYQVGGRVLVNGTDIGADVVSVSVARDIPEGLPGASAAFQSASADVVADLSDVVTSMPRHPWNRMGNWPPRPSDVVEVWLSDGANEWRQIRGHITALGGSSSTGRVSFTVADTYQGLDRSVNIPALSDAMPALTDANTYRYIGLQATYLTDTVLRQAGRYCTPPMSSGCFVSVPFQGSTWPERGTALTSVKLAADSISAMYPNWYTSPYGLKVHNIDATYAPFIWSEEDTVFDQPLEITQEIVDIREGSTFLYVRFTGGGQLAIAMTSLSVFARYYPPSGEHVPLVQVSKGLATRVTARFTLTGNTLSASVRTRGADGTLSATTTGSAEIVAGNLSGPVSTVRATGAGAQGAFQAAYPTSAWSALDHKPTAVIHADNGGRNSFIGIPTQINVNAVDLLTKQAEAEFAAWWIDENDVLQWWDRGLLMSRPPVGTLTAADHIKEIPWEHDMNSLRRSVHVDYERPEVVSKWRTDLTLWTGSGETYSEGETEEVFVNVPDDEIWLGVDYENPTRYSANTLNYYVINRGIRSVIGGIAIGSGGAERTTNSVIPGIRRVTDDTFAFSIQVSALGADESAALQFPQDAATDPALWARWRGKDLPILRGKKKITFLDARDTSATTGPAAAPDLIHDVGWLIQRPEYARATADYAAAITTADQPIIPSLDIMPVFNLQVGDIITVSDPEVMGIDIRALVVGNDIDADFAAGSASQSLRLRPLSVTRNGATWAEFGAAKAATAFGAWGTSRAGDTWAAFGSNPLK